MNHYMTKFSAITWIVLILVCSSSVKCERWDGNTLYDLEGQGADFLAQAENWAAVGLKSSAIVTTCNGNDILGGYNILQNNRGGYFERDYTNLPSHNQISFYMNFYPVDSVDSNDYVQIQFDNYITNTWGLSWSSPYTHAICGGTAWLDFDNIKTYIVLPHNSSSLTFRATAQFDEPTDNESFGFRDISFTFETVNTTTNDFCGSTLYPLPNNWCSCPVATQIMFPAHSGTCYGCDSSCATCTGPYRNQCITCYPGYYLVNNNTCIPICPEPFYPTTNGVIDFCETPCPSRFAYKSGACGSTCPAPLHPYGISVLLACVCFSTDPDSNPCYTCDISCTTCNGTAANECLTCFEGFYVENQSGLQYGTCEPCDSSCVTCYGGAANQCNSCSSDQYLVLDGSVNNGTCGNCDSSCVTCYGGAANQCNSCSSDTFLVLTGSVNNGTCGTCDPTCLTCDDITNTDCLSCPPSFYLDLNPSPAIEGACLACNSTCASCTGPASNECTTCYSGDYLVTHNTCVSECNAPFLSTSNSVIDFCDTPCLGQYAYQNQTCTDTCATLYQGKETAVVLKQCVCTGYSYSNGSCLATCPSPMTIRVEDGLKYCIFGCPPGQYLYYDGTCSTSCDAPSIPRAEGGYLFCDYGGCDSVQIKHIKHTQTGHEYAVTFIPQTTCIPDVQIIQDTLNIDNTLKTYLSDPQFIVQKKKQVYNVQLILAEAVLNNLQLSVKLIGLDGTLPVPKKLVADELGQNLISAANSASSGMGFITGSNILASLSLQNTASAWGFVGFQQFITFFKYANIDFPLQLEFFFLLGGATDFANAPNLLAEATASEYTQIEDNDDIMDQQAPPDKFFYYDATSFFIKNGGATFLLNWTALAIVFVVILIKRIPSLKKSKVYKFIEMADDKLRWNFVLRGFLSTGLPQSISIFLQLRVLSNHESYLSLSAALTIIALLHYIGMCAFIFYILHKNNFEDMKKEEIKKRYSTLADGMELNSNYAKYYHVLMLLRGVTLAFVVVYVEKLALLQVIMMVLFNIGLVYFLFKTEFEERRETIKTRITEVLIIVMELCFTMLTRSGEKEHYYNSIGWLTFAIIGFMFLNELIFALTSQYFGIKETIKSIKEKYHAWRKKRAEKMSAKVTAIKKPEEQAKFLSGEPRSGMVSPNASVSPTAPTNLLLLEPQLSIKDFSQALSKDFTPKGSARETMSFGRKFKILPAPISPMAQNGLSDNELISGERSPISVSLETGALRETDALWGKAGTPASRNRRTRLVFPDRAVENVEEVVFLDMEK